MTTSHTRSLKQRIIQSGSWTLFGYGFNQALRLGGNLVLTRLLFPEAFGLMAIFQAINYGVHQMTDVGIGSSIIQKERGNDPAFLNTAWTVQVIRGFLAWGILCALAYPVALFYNEPQLATMIPVVALTAIIGGFNSTRLYTAQRNMEAARATLIEIGTASIGLVCTILLAWQLQSVWALVWGNIITLLLQLAASHTLLHGIRNRFAWEKDALNHMTGFGRWIMLNSFLTFLAAEGTRLILGAMLDMRQLALYTIASTLSLMLWQATVQLVWRVFFPAYSEVHRTRPHELDAILRKARLSIILPSWTLAIFFMFFGSHITDFLYDERYRGAGPMLEILAAGMLASCIWGSYVGVLVATGRVARSTLLTALQIFCQVVAMFIGHHFLAGPGIIIGIAAANWVMYPVNAWIMSRSGVWQPRMDLALLAASIAILLPAWPHLNAALQ